MRFIRSENALGHIQSLMTENTGGGCMVDFAELGDGTCLGVNNECMVLYPSNPSKADDYEDELGVSWFEDINIDGWPEADKPTALKLAYIEKWKTLTSDEIIHFSYLELQNGIVIIIDDVNVMAYESFSALEEDKPFATIER